MKKYLFLLFIIVVGFTEGDVQKEWIVLKWDDSQIVENGASVYAELNFEDAGFPDPVTNLPVFYRIYTLDNQTQNYKFSVEGTVYEEVKLSSQFPGVDKITNEIQIESQINQSAGIKKLHLQITAIKKEGNKIFRLKSFQIKQIPVEATELLKSANASKESHT